MTLAILNSIIVILGVGFLLPLVLNSERQNLTSAIREKAQGNFVRLSGGLLIMKLRVRKTVLLLL